MIQSRLHDLHLHFMLGFEPSARISQCKASEMFIIFSMFLKQIQGGLDADAIHRFAQEFSSPSPCFFGCW